MLDKKLLEYAEKFQENFPIFLMMGETDDVIIERIQECLDNDHVYQTDTIIDALY